MTAKTQILAWAFLALPLVAQGAAVATRGPDLRADGISKFSSPNGDASNPYSGHILPQDHVINQPVYPPMNEKLYKADISRTLSSEDRNLCLHPGTWLRQEPENVPNLELEPIGYSRQWLGEERMGGGWSSAADPLSIDRKRFIEEVRQQANVKVPRAGSRSTSPLPEEDDEEETLKTHVIRTDADGNVHVMPRKR